MSVQETNLKAIADAIREKDGTTEPIPSAEDFPDRIRAIPTDFSNLIKLPGGGEMTVGAEFGSAPYQIEATKDPDGEEFVTKTQMNEAVSGKISSTAVGTVVMLTEAEYTALTTKVADRMYLIKE